jgi:hypothetical protein
MLGVLLLAIFTKIRMFFVLLELLGVIVGLLLACLVAVDLYNTVKQPKPPVLPTPPPAPVEPAPAAPTADVKPKRVRKSKKFSPPQSL